MGAADAEIEGEWRWRSDNSLMSINSSMTDNVLGWTTGEPNSGSTSNCLRWNPAQNAYEDYNCGSTNRYVCEHKRECNLYLLSISS